MGKCKCSEPLENNFFGFIFFWGGGSLPLLKWPPGNPEHTSIWACHTGLPISHSWLGCQGFRHINIVRAVFIHSKYSTPLGKTILQGQIDMDWVSSSSFPHRHCSCSAGSHIHWDTCKTVSGVVQISAEMGH